MKRNVIATLLFVGLVPACGARDSLWTGSRSGHAGGNGPLPGPDAGSDADASGCVWTIELAGSYATLFSPRSVAHGDFDDDGDLDLAIAITDEQATNDGLAVHLNQGDATFAGAVSFAPDGDYRAVDVGDLDGDGILDIVAVGQTQAVDCADMMFGYGDGTFWGFL